VDAAVLDRWSLPQPRTLSRAEQGLNNETWFVRCAGEEYVLRIYAEDRLDAIRFEHELLHKLIELALPFRTPRPVPTADADTIAVATTQEGPRPAALFHRLPGETLDDDDVAGVRSAGAAFAELDRVLGSIERTNNTAPAFHGDFRQIHPAVSDLADLDQVIGVDAARFVRTAADNAQALYASLPRQIVHGDFAFSNILVKGGKVTALLDFEFAGWDLRAAELGGALALSLSKTSGDQLWRQLLRGYLASLGLDTAEIAALPALALQHEAVILTWWSGRALSGRASRESVAQHVERALRLEGWMARSGARLVAEAFHLSA
jgi:homoserine kinase type II